MEAGADVIESATYQASIDGFCEHHQVAREEAYQLLVKGARLAVEARDEVWRELQRNNSCKIILYPSLVLASIFKMLVQNSSSKISACPDLATLSYMYFKSL